MRVVIDTNCLLVIIPELMPYRFIFDNPLFFSFLRKLPKSSRDDIPSNEHILGIQIAPDNNFALMLSILLINGSIDRKADAKTLGQYAASQPAAKQAGK